MLVNACNCPLTKPQQNNVSTDLDNIQQLQVELNGNIPALNELKQLQLLFEYYNKRNKEKTLQLKEAYKELEEQTQHIKYLENLLNKSKLT